MPAVELCLFGGGRSSTLFIRNEGRGFFICGKNISFQFIYLLKAYIYKYCSYPIMNGNGSGGQAPELLTLIFK